MSSPAAPIVTDNTASKPTVRLRVEGMTCGGCVARIERAFDAVDGVLSARANLATATVTLDVDEPAPPSGKLIDAVRRAGYDATPFRPETSTAPAIELTDINKLREQRQALIQGLGLAVPVVAIH